MADVKVTISEKFDALMGVDALTDIVFEDGQTALEFLADRKAKNIRKASSKGAVKPETQAVVDALLAIEDDTPRTATQYVALLGGEYSGQRVSRVLNDLVAKGEYTKGKNGKSSTFARVLA